MLFGYPHPQVGFVRLATAMPAAGSSDVYLIIDIFFVAMASLQVESVLIHRIQHDNIVLG
jgi:hypothetical protein